MTTVDRFYIDGNWRPPHSPVFHPLIDATTEEQYGQVALGDAHDADAAVSAARAAFPAWSATDPQTRIDFIKRIREIYLERMEEMAARISQEVGAPIDLARNAQAPIGVRHMDNYLAAMEGFDFVRMLGDHAPDNRIVYEPVGVVALITPWNWPINQVAMKVIAALLAGCAVILKPSEFSPLSADLFAEILDAAGLPPGVFNLVHGDGAGVGTRLSVHRDVDMVSFTGSTRAGIAISKAAADTLKVVALELGGKGANLVFADADEMAVERGVRACFNNSGQSCNAPSRMLVERPVYEAVVEKAAAVAKSIPVGPSNEPGPHLGPVISERQYERIQSLIQKGLDEGARLVAGGPGRPAGVNRGYFVRPTVFADVDNDMTIAREEIFGPVLSIIPFDTEEEAVRIANDTIYGLSNYVQSASDERRQRLSRLLRSGTVEMNGKPRGAGAFFGGVKASGHAREGGRYGIEEFLQPKAVSGWN